MEEKRINPILNLVREEWNHLGDRKSYFIFASVFFVIATAIGLFPSRGVLPPHGAIAERLTVVQMVQALFA